MSSEASLLAEIRALPDDDVPRLVYADWLEDNGDTDRAEFLLLQVRLVRAPEHSPERFELEERSEDLLARHQRAWLAHLPKWARELGLTFRRGMPEEASLTAAAWIRHGAGLARLVPLRRLEVTTWERLDEVARLVAATGLTELECRLHGLDSQRAAAFFGNLRTDRLRRLVLRGGAPAPTGLTEALLAWPGLERLTGLGLRGFLGLALRPLFASRRLGALEWLDLWSARVESTAWEALAGNERLVGLRRLVPGQVPREEAAILCRAFARACWERLEELALPTIAPMDLRALLATRWAAGLRSLGLSLPADSLPRARLEHLSNLRLSGRSSRLEWLAKLAGSDLVGGLTSLSLEQEIGDEGAAILAGAARLARLYRLSLVDPGIGAAGAAALVDSPHLAGLRELEMWRAPLGPAAGAALAERPGLSRLRVLTLGVTGLGDEGVAALARSAHVGGLARLNLHNNNLGPAGVRALVEAGWLSSLRELSLAYNRVGDSGVQALANCPTLAGLGQLNLAGNRITSLGAAALADSPYLGRLLRLTVAGHRVDRATRARLRERFGAGVAFAD
jgi:uncharacterized protein (TIGR02996 family)